MSLGLKKAGYRHILMVEKDAACVCTLENNGFENVLHADVREVNFYPANGVDLVAGGVPCQPFSNAGNRLGRDDPRDGETLCIQTCYTCTRLDSGASIAVLRFISFFGLGLKR